MRRLHDEPSRQKSVDICSIMFFYGLVMMFCHVDAELLLRSKEQTGIGVKIYQLLHMVKRAGTKNESQGWTGVWVTLYRL